MQKDRRRNTCGRYQNFVPGQSMLKRENLFIVERVLKKSKSKLYFVSLKNKKHSKKLNKIFINYMTLYFKIITFVYKNIFYI